MPAIASKEDNWTPSYVKHHREWRKKMFAPGPKPDPVSPPVVEPKAEVKLTAIDAMAAQICTVFGVTPQQMVQDYKDPLAVGALSTVMGLCVRRLKMTSYRVADHFGTPVDTVDKALEFVDGCMNAWSLTQYTPLGDVAALMLRAWKEHSATRIRVSDVINAVAWAAGLRTREMLSPRRSHNLVVPRQIAMALAHHLTARSLPEIGRAFGGKDHTTVLHAVRKFEPLIRFMEETDQFSNLLPQIAKRALAIADSKTVPINTKPSRTLVA